MKQQTGLSEEGIKLPEEGTIELRTVTRRMVFFLKGPWSWSAESKGDRDGTKLWDCLAAASLCLRPGETGPRLPPAPLGGTRPDPCSGAPSPPCDLTCAPPAPDLPTHLQVLRWGQQDPRHVQSHVPLPQNHGGVTAQVWCQLEGRRWHHRHLVTAPQPSGSPMRDDPLPSPAPPLPRGLPRLTSRLSQPNVSHVSSLGASQAWIVALSSHTSGVQGLPWRWLRGRAEEALGMLPKLTSRFSGSPLYQPTKARAENTPGSSSPGISRV